MKSSRQLRYWYLKWNRLYFDDSLSHEEVILLWEPVDGGVAECERKDSIVAAGHERQGRFHIIRIDPSLRAKKSQWGMALLHEMVHVKLDPYAGHGKKFQDEMLRLAQASAFRDLW